ncbi:hypothetical protein HYN43_010225 [Mucilaginibacter celer]|uniref:Uncharacterized protein n=1 Tax=Mucilaginibacter celer TaxID=2305508 RepID=A0A494VXC2_9SPHI|nr:hypothetical protein HYN43_010225 [Mucilaginibacter celer]
MDNNPEDFATLFLRKGSLAMPKLIENLKVSVIRIDHLLRDFGHNTKEEILSISRFKRSAQPKSVWLHHYMINYFLRNLKCFRSFDFAIDCVIEIKCLSQNR